MMLPFCSTILRALIALGDPMQVDENEIRLAIDLLAQELEPGFERRIQVPEGSRRELLVLMNDNPKLRALSIGDEIVVERVK